MNQELLGLFVTEGGEYLQQAWQDLAALEQAPEDLSALESLFRAVHTLKGSAGLVDFAAMGELFHAAEDRLAEVRAGTRALDPPLRDGLAAALAQAEGWLETIGREGALPAGALRDAAAATAQLAGALPAPSAPARPAGLPAWAEPLVHDWPEPGEPLVAIRYAPRPDSYFAGIDPAALLAAAPDLRRVAIGPRESFGDLAAYDPFACNLQLTAISAAPLPAVEAAFRFVADEVEIATIRAPGVAAADPAPAAAPALRTLRVEAERIDALAAAAEDLVIAKNALAHVAAQAADGADRALARALSMVQIDLDRRISRLHETVTRLRLVPLAPLFRRFPRLVRDTAGALGKSAEITLAGEDVEVDKSVVDALFEPLLHLIRNALDHGIETPAARQAAGKPPAGGLRLSARTSGETALIELADDGRGIDADRVRATALARGIMDAPALAALSDDQALELIFAPGFSTAAEVSDLSGRGVGLDAVRSAVAALGGAVEVHSRPGRGATFTLSAPLRVRLARLMVVETAGESFGVPLEDLVETTRVTAGEITAVRAGHALVWRDQAVPIIKLSELLSLPTPANEPEALNVLIVRAGGEPAAVAVDSFGERIEAPLKPMTRLLSGLAGVSGTTLLGDGRVLMVLDLEALIA